VADWQKVQLSDNPTLTAIAETGTQAIGTVNAALEVVQAAGEAAKLFLLGTVNPAALALILLADQLIAALQNFRESGLFVVQVNPFQQPYGLKNTNDIGLEMQRDSQGLVIFNESKVTAPRSLSAFSGEVFTVNDEYRKSLDLKDLSSDYRDFNGETKDFSTFTPPIPELDKSLKLVPGGYDPATWTGTKVKYPTTDFGIPLPEFPAPDCIELLAAAFEDEGDVPRFILNSSTYTGDAYTFSGDKFPITDTTALLPQELYQNANTSLTTTERVLLTTRISSGKPNYQGNTELSGLSVSALAMVVAAQNPKEWVDELLKVLKFFPGVFAEFERQVKDLLNQLNELTLPVDTVRVRTDNRFGGGDFVVGDFVKGRTSGCVGKIESISDSTPSVMKRKITSVSVLRLSSDGSGHMRIPNVDTFDENADNNFNDVTMTIKNYSGLIPIRNWEAGESILEAEPFETLDGEKSYQYRYHGQNLGGGGGAAGRRPIPNSRKPKQGFIINQFPTVPDSVTPDFFSYRLADLIPGYSDFFDDMINIAETIKAFAEGVLEAIQIIIDAIDDLVEYFEEIAANIIALIELLTIGLPNAGVWFMGMTSQNGSDAFASALRSAGNAPDASYKISAGFCFVGAPQFDPDPVKAFFSALGVEYQSVG